MFRLLVLVALCPLQAAPPRADAASCVARVKEIHGGAGPWAIIGFRVGERALRELGASRGDFDLQVVHCSPKEVQYSCVADGLQAATGCSLGKLNLALTETPKPEMRTQITYRGKTLVFRVQPALAKSITDVPMPKLAEAGERVAKMTDDELFVIER